MQVQYNLVNKGKCGICGDQWSGVRRFEAGGRYAKGIISRTYQQGQDIQVQVGKYGYTFQYMFHIDRV